MGESLVEAPKVENKMGESITHVPCLQESVSFGRFEHDSLCWERWSTFPTNKYLEEVEKCSTPGSVAQKKAYFEAHYKKIAARKAALLEEEMRREAESMNDESQIVMDSVCNSSEEELNVEKSNTHDSIYGDELQNLAVDFAGDMGHEHVEVPTDGIDLNEEENDMENFRADVSEHIDNEHIDGGDIIEEENEVVNFTNEVSEHIDEHNDGADVVEENKDFQPQPEDAAEDMCPNMESPELEMPENPVVMKEEKEVENISTEVSEHTKEPIDDACIIEEIKDIQPQTEGTSEDSCPRMENPELKPEEPVSVKEVVEATLVFEDKEDLPQVKAERTKLAKKEPVNVARSDNLKKMQKVTPVKKTPNSTGVKKKPASPMPKRSVAPMPKSPMVSTPKPAKPVLSKTAMSTTRPSVKKENGFTPMTVKKSTRPESKRVLPTSLHMSLRLGPANTDPAALTTARKSLIMERMGDKDIVKRAFKAFQNSNQSPPSSLARGPATNQSVSKKIEQKDSNPSMLQKKNEGNLRSVKAANPRTGQQGPAKTSSSPGLRKTIGVDQRNGKSTPASYGMSSQDRENKQKEVPKKLEQKSEIKGAGKTQLQSKVKLQKAAETGKPSHNINSKAKLSSSCNLGRVSKGLYK